MYLVPQELVSGGGTMGDLIRSRAWEDTNVGPISQWPTNLLNIVSVILSSRFPMIMYWGPRFEVIYNDASIPIFGVRHPAALGKLGCEVWPEIWSVLEPMFQEVVAGGATWNENQPLILTRNNYEEETYFTYGFSPVRLEDGSVGGIVAPLTETTERVLGERRLRTLREFGTRASQLEDVEVACRVCTDIFEANIADTPFAALYLLEQNKLILKSTNSIAKGHPAFPVEISIDADDSCVWPAHRVMASGTSVVVEGLEAKLGRLTSELGFELRQHAVALSILGTEGRAIGMLVLGVNVRRVLDDDYMGYFELVAGQVAKSILTVTALQEEKKRAAMLAELDQAKTIFFSNVSHEFRTPLTLIMGPLEDSLADALHPLPPAHRARMTIVQRNAKRLLRLVNSILDFSRIEAGRMQAKFEAVDLPAFTEDLASVFRAAFEKAGIDLIVTTTPLEDEIYVDIDMWEKIVYNLLSNAIKYTARGSVHVSITSRDNYAMLSVSDTGVGIAEDELSAVFDRFHRVERSEGRSHEGTGIGLSLTQELVKLHGGQITLNSKLGVGSTFSVVIPYGTSHLLPMRIKHAKKKQVMVSQLGQAFVDEALRWTPTNAMHNNTFGDHTQADRALPVDVPLPKKGRILLADDNSDIREYVCSLLQRRWDCVAVRDGLEALIMLQNNPEHFDLVLTDVMMPRMNGLEFLAAVKADERTRYLPVILLSARAGSEAAVEGLEAGADDYLIKPFGAKELLARVSTHLELSRLRRQLEHLVEERTAKLAQVNGELNDTLKERLRAEQALRISEQHYRTLAKASPVGIIHTDAQAKAFYINDRWSGISGHDKNEGMELGWLDLVYHEDLESVSRAVQEAIKGNPLKLEFRYENRLTEPPSIRWVLGQDSPDIDENGVVQGFVCTVTDITERKQLEKERYDACAQAEMEQRMRAVDAEENKRNQAQFIDMICHEIRNPLNGIMNSIDIMKLHAEKVNPLILAIKDTIPNGEEIYDKAILDMEYLNMIEQCAAHQLVITDDVIRASKLEAHKVVLSMVNFVPYNLIDNIVNTYSAELTTKQIAMDIEIDIPKTLVLHTDPDRISQILMNLLTNAIKFTDKSSTRKISVWSRIITEAEHPESHIIETTITDTGLGMTDEEQALIFQRFAQARANTFHEYGGSGLGLYISKMLVELLGGEITVSSKKSQGTTFKFTIRCGSAVETEDSKGKEKEVEVQRNTESPGIRILIVEDNFVNQKVLLRQLTMAGYLCDVANNGQEAVDNHELGSYDLIFMDVEMPIMNGFEATKVIRRREKEKGTTKGVVIIGLSGNARGVFSEIGQSIGMNDYVVKPYKREDLQKKIKDHLALVI